MKKMRGFCFAALLTVTFAVSASAGEIECGVTGTPPPPPQGRAGDIECGRLGFELTEAVYGALKGVWMIF